MNLAGLVAFVGAAFGLVFGGMEILTRFRQRTRLRRRLDSLPPLAQLDEETSDAARVDRVMRAGHPLQRALDARFPLAGGPRTTFIAALWGVGMAAVATASAAFFGLAFVWAALVGAGAGVAMARNVGNTLEGRQRHRYEQGFLVVIEDFQRMVHFGIGSQQAFTAVVSGAEPPVDVSLLRVSRAVDLGVELAQAMDEEARRVRIGELSMLAAIFATQSRAGGNLSEAVENLATMLRERLDNRMRLRAMSAESRITLIILSIVPVVAIAIQSVMQPDLVRLLVAPDGRSLLGIGVGLILAGLLIARFMIARAQR